VVEYLWVFRHVGFFVAYPAGTGSKMPNSISSSVENIPMNLIPSRTEGISIAR
jgi:hypothetical protein